MYGVSVGMAVCACVCVSASSQYCQSGSTFDVSQTFLQSVNQASNQMRQKLLASFVGVLSALSVCVCVCVPGWLCVRR